MNSITTTRPILSLKFSRKAKPAQKSAFGENPFQLPQHMMHVRELAMNGEYLEAMKRIDQLMHKDPENIPLLFIGAKILTRDKCFMQANDWLERLERTIGSDWPEIRELRAELSEAEGKVKIHAQHPYINRGDGEQAETAPPLEPENT